MSVNSESQSGSKDLLLWSLVFIILAVAVVGNTYFAAINVALRAAAVVAMVAIAGFLAIQTQKGKSTLTFARESRQEIRKVVWPTRQETVQTTLMVLAVTAVMGLFLFLLDGALVWLVNLVTGV